MKKYLFAYGNALVSQKFVFQSFIFLNIYNFEIGYGLKGRSSTSSSCALDKSSSMLQRLLFCKRGWLCWACSTPIWERQASIWISTNGKSRYWFRSHERVDSWPRIFDLKSQGRKLDCPSNRFKTSRWCDKIKAVILTIAKWRI